VTRNEIQRCLWGDNTCVDFERGINFCVNQIRATLGDDAEKPRYVKTLPRRGYRFIAPVNIDAALTASAIGGRISERPTDESFPSLAVLPFENLSGDLAQDYFAEGMTETLITELGKISALRVIARQSVMQYKGTKKTVPQIAGELKINAVFEGSVLRVGDRVRVSVQLIEAAPERHLWADSYDRRFRDVLALHSEIARTVAKEITVTLTPQEETRLAGGRAVNPLLTKPISEAAISWTGERKQTLTKPLCLLSRPLSSTPRSRPRTPAYRRYTSLLDCTSRLAKQNYWRRRRPLR
jgi:TolB-like protein